MVPVETSGRNGIQLRCHITQLQPGDKEGCWMAAVNGNGATQKIWPDAMVICYNGEHYYYLFSVEETEKPREVTHCKM